jgi:hypothetical protein
LFVPSNRCKLLLQSPVVVDVVTDALKGLGKVPGESSVPPKQQLISWQHQLSSRSSVWPAYGL